MNIFVNFNVQALVHLLSAVDGAKILISREHEISEKMLLFKQCKNIAHITSYMGTKELESTFSISNNDKEIIKPRIEDDKKAEEDSQGTFAERPVITFDANLSHLQLTPQRDLQVSWTVEFWLKREDPTVSDSETDSESVLIPGAGPGSETGGGNHQTQSQSSSGSVARSLQQHDSTIRDYAAALSEGLGLGLGLGGTENFLPPIPHDDSRPLRSILGTRPVNSLSSGVRGISGKTQVSLSKLSRILGSDFGILGSSSSSNSGPSLWGWDQGKESLGVERNLNNEIERDENGKNKNDEVSDRVNGEGRNDDNYNDENDEYGRINDEEGEGEKQKTDSSWTLIPPAAAMDPLLSIALESDEIDNNDLQNIYDLRLSQIENQITSSQQYGPGYEEESMSNPEIRFEANRALLAILEKVTGFECFDQIIFPGSDEVEGRELGREFSEELGSIEGGDAIDQLINRQKNLFHGITPKLMDDTHAELEVQGPSHAELEVQGPSQELEVQGSSHAEQAVQGPSQSQSETRMEEPHQYVTAARTSTSTSTSDPINTNMRRRNSVSLSQSMTGNLTGKENERERDEMEKQGRYKKEVEVNVEGEKSDDKSNEKLKEIEKEKVKEIIIPPIYLLSSPSGHIKLQLGGRVYTDNEINDPLQSSNPIESQSYCISIGQRGATEKSFDYIVPKNKWVHLSITCCVGGNSASGSSSSSSSSVVSIYENGELKDFQTMRCYLPIGTFGIQKKNQTFQGHLSEMRVWNYARTALEIQRDLHTDVSGTYVCNFLCIFFFEIFCSSF